MADTPNTPNATAVAPGDAQQSTSSTSSDAKRVGLIGLIGVVISAMVGGGIYDLPQNMTADAGGLGIIIAWAITGIGMWFIANTFRVLAQAKPELKNGLYTYASRGFGKLVGFFVAYGYWICNCFALVAYGVLIMSTLNYFFPGSFEGGKNWWSIIGASAISWLMFVLACRGAKSSSFINIIGTIGKIIPVLVFLIACLTVFNFATFFHGFFGMDGSKALAFNFGDVMGQASSTMLVTLWLFIGIEGAVVVSGQATSQNDVARATTIGYLAILVLYVLSSLLPLGVYDQTQIAAMENPSMAAIMLDKFGSWGEILINIGVIISVLSSWLVWMLMLGQMPLFAAEDGIFPKSFGKTNDADAPTKALLWTAIIIQALLILCHFLPGNAWTTMISITSVMAMPCYLLCCLFLWKIAKTEPWPKIRFSKTNGLVTGILGTIFSLFLVYSAGLNYLMVACIIYAIGIPIFFVGLKQNGATGTYSSMLGKWEKVLLAIVVVLGIIGIVYACIGGIF